MPRLRLAWCWLLPALLVAACTTPLGHLPEDPQHELTTVPFYPQTIHQCGPAALATALGASGITVEPATLSPEVYLPGRRGSLQVEMLATARRQGRLAYVIEPRFDTLVAELDAGHPVLVLQDLGAFGIRRWHYAVVIGFNPADDLVVLRSGTQRRRLVSRQRFLHTWKASDHWGVVITPASQPPATATGQGYVEALLSAAPFLPPTEVEAAYTLMQTRWPVAPLVLFAAGNRAYALGRVTEAISDYRALLVAEPGHVAGLNNLANALLDSGCPAEALRSAQRAVELVDAASPLAASVADTRTNALAAARNAGTAPGSSAPARRSSVCTAE